MTGADSSTVPPEPLFGRYRVDGVLGEGGLGTVWKAFDLRLKRFVAIKTIKRSLTTDVDLFRALEERFAREAEAGSRMGMHPNLVTVYDLVIEEDRTQYLILEYVPNGTVADWIGDASLSLSEALRVTMDVSRALQAAHDAGIVHRDIKPANIFIGGDRRAQLGDFGIAQVDAISARTHASVNHPGTPLYMSPEQAATTGYMRPESDQYSLGLVLFEMVTGKVYKRLRKRDIMDRLHALPAPVVSLIEQMTTDDPDDRFASMAAVEQAIGRIRLQDAPSASTLTIPERDASHDPDATILGATPSAETQLGSRADDGTTTRATPRLGLNPVPAIHPPPPVPQAASLSPRVSRRVAITGIGAIVVGTGAGALLLQRHPNPEPQPPVGTTIAFAGTGQVPTSLPPTHTVTPPAPTPSPTPSTAALSLTVTPPVQATASVVVNPSPTSLSVLTATLVPTIGSTAAPVPTATDVPPPSQLQNRLRRTYLCRRLPVHRRLLSLHRVFQLPCRRCHQTAPRRQRGLTGNVGYHWRIQRRGEQSPQPLSGASGQFVPHRRNVVRPARLGKTRRRTCKELTGCTTKSEVFELDSGDGVHFDVYIGEANQSDSSPMSAVIGYRERQNNRQDRLYSFDSPRATTLGGLSAASMSYQSVSQNNSSDVHSVVVTYVISQGWAIAFEYYTDGPQMRDGSDLMAILQSVTFAR